MEKSDTGLLLNRHNILLQRIYFKQMLDLRGISIIHRAPKPGTKNYDLHGELNALYEPPVEMKCIFEEHPTEWTMRKLGWNSVLQPDNALIQVPYGVKEAQQELAGINPELREKEDNAHTVQAGSLFIIPSGLDNTKGRVFKVVRMSNIAVFPANITCEIGPVFTNSFEPGKLHDFQQSGLTLLNTAEDVEIPVEEPTPVPPVKEDDYVEGNSVILKMSGIYENLWVLDKQDEVDDETAHI